MNKVHTATAVVAALFLASCVFGHTVALRMLLLGTGLILASVVAFWHRKDVRLLPPIWLPFLLWGGWALLSIAWSIEPDRSEKEWRNEVFYTGAGLWICYLGAQAHRAVWIFGLIGAGAALITCGIGVYEFSRGLAAYNVGWHGGPGDHSSALVVLMPCVALAGWYAARARWPAWLQSANGALAALLLASAYTTLNRTLWLSFAVQFFLAGALILARIPAALKNSRGRAAAAALALTVVVGCSAVLVSIHAERQTVGAQALQKDHRLALWPEIFRYIEARPLTGYGFGRGVLRDQLQSHFKDIDTNLWHAHNLFLEALIQSGLPGMLLLVVLLGVLLREAWRVARQADEATAACGIALLAVIAGMLVRNMTDSLFVRQNALLFWGVSGVLLAWTGRAWRAPS
jgi:O-antigen ligase